MEIKYRILFFRKAEDKNFHSCFCWSRYGESAATGYIKDLFKLDENKITLKAEVVEQ